MFTETVGPISHPQGFPQLLQPEEKNQLYQELSRVNHKLAEKACRSFSEKMIQCELKQKLGCDEVAQKAIWNGCEQVLNLYAYQAMQQLPECLEKLNDILRGGGDVNLCNDKGEFLLHKYAGIPELVELLLAHGANPMLIDYKGQNALFCTNLISSFETLFTYAKQPKEELMKQRDVHGETILTSYVHAYGHSKKVIEVVTYLIQCGGDLNAKNFANQNLAERSAKGNISIGLKDLESLIDLGLDIKVDNILRDPILHQAVNKVILLMEKGAPITPSILQMIVNSYGCLMPKMAPTVLQHADFSMVGWSAYHFAAMTNCHEFLENIPFPEVNVPTKDKEDTPLHLAMVKNHFYISFLLLEKGTDPTLKNRKGCIPSTLGAKYRKQPLDLLVAIYTRGLSVQERDNEVLQLLTEECRKCELLDCTEEENQTYSNELKSVQEYILKREK